MSSVDVDWEEIELDWDKIGRVLASACRCEDCESRDNCPMDSLRSYYLKHQQDSLGN
jgi:hypothetical protein